MPKLAKLSRGQKIKNLSMLIEVLLFLLCAAQAAALVWLTYRGQNLAQLEALRTVEFAKDMGQLLSAKSLTEHATAKAQTSAAELQLKYLADTLAQSGAKKAEKQKELEPQWATTDAGSKIDLRDYIA